MEEGAAEEVRESSDDGRRDRKESKCGGTLSTMAGFEDAGMGLCAEECK